jgi:RNA polymerase sporulation-specific sigma factor
MHFRAGRKRAQDVSLSDLIETGAEGAALEILDAVAGEEDLLETFQAREDARLLRAAVDRVLTDQEREVVLMRYGLFGRIPTRQRQVAEKLGISRSYVSRIEKRALEKLRMELEK